MSEQSKEETDRAERSGRAAPASGPGGRRSLTGPHKALTRLPDTPAVPASAGSQAGSGAERRSYEVGYGRPPVHGRFKKGRSGNPAGRPRGSKNKLPGLDRDRLKRIILEEAYRTITVNEAGRPVTLPMAQAVIRTLGFNAAKGQHRALQLFTELLSSTEQEQSRLEHEWFETAVIYKTDWEKELARRKALGVTGPEPLPHPDHVVINPRTGTVRITGPMTREEKEDWDTLHELKDHFETRLSDLHEELDHTKKPARRRELKNRIQHAQNILTKLNKHLPV